MATLKELRDERLRKLQELKRLGVNPYPAQATRTHDIQMIHAEFSRLEGKTVTTLGRITSIRKFGKIAFIVIKDAGAELQLVWRHDENATADRGRSELQQSEIGLLDAGDFIEASGKVMKTQTGEESVEVEKLRLLTKSLRPLPTKQEGFTNKEERLRRRYVDMNVNEDVRQRFIRRSKFWTFTREFLNQHGFIEINIPVLEHTTGGADANPFVTHMDALDQDFYLRISHELPLKRLLGAGFEKVYDIGPRFRNENYSDEHLPEHVAMEFYWAYADWTTGMRFMEELMKYVLEKTFGKLKFTLANGKFDVDLAKEWKKWDYADVIQKHYGLDIFQCSLEDVKKALKDHKLEVEQTENKARGIDKLWKNIRKDVAGPVWLINIPTFISPLAKTNPDRPETTQRFQAVIAGSELTNDFSELNDPLDQLERFKEQQKMRDAGDDEAMMLDIDFVEMLEYGMPPACGFSYSERLFWVFEGVSAREGVPFPQLRHEIDETTKTIYPDLYTATAKTAKSRPQDFTKRIVTVLNKDLESWQAANAVAHMNAILGNELPKEKLVTADYFISSDQQKIPRNPQYPIIVMKASEKELHKLLSRTKAKKLIHHVFIKEMQDTNNDQEITDSLQKQTLTDTTFYGISFFAPNETADELTKGLQLWK